jgi:hypothetical protein
MIRRSNRSRVPGSDSGVVLATGLILLLVLTVLAVSAMATATTERWLSGNYQFVEEALACAEAGIAQATVVASLPIDPAATAAQYLDPESRSPTPRRGSGTPIAACPAQPSAPEDRSEYFLRFAEVTPVPGGDAESALRAWHFVVDSVGVGGRGATTELQAGFYVIASGATAMPPCRSSPGPCANPIVGEPVRSYWRQRGVD